MELGSYPHPVRLPIDGLGPGREFRLPAMLKHLHLRFGGLHSHPRPEAAHQPEEPGSLRFSRLGIPCQGFLEAAADGPGGHDRDVEIGDSVRRVHTPEFLGSDPHDPESHPVQDQGPVRHGRIGAELPAPEAMAQDHLRTVQLRFAHPTGEARPVCQRNAKYVEVVVGDHPGLRLHQIIAPADRHLAAALRIPAPASREASVGHDVLEGLPVLPVE